MLVYQRVSDVLETAVKQVKRLCERPGPAAGWPGRLVRPCALQEHTNQAIQAIQASIGM